MGIAITAGCIFLVSTAFVILGLGGGILFVPILHWAGYDLQTVAIPLGLLLNGINTVLALGPYGRAGLVEWRASWPMAVGAAVFAPTGAMIQPLLRSDLLLVLFAFAVAAAAVRALLSASRSKAGTAHTPREMKLHWGFAVGGSVGLIGGLLGIGAGFIVAPVFMFLGYSPRHTAATTAFVVAVCSFTGFAGYVGQSALPMLLLLAAAVAVLIGSRLGTTLMLKASKPAWINWGYAAVLAGVAARLVWEAATFAR